MRRSRQATTFICVALAAVQPISRQQKHFDASVPRRHPPAGGPPCVGGAPRSRLGPERRAAVGAVHFGGIEFGTICLNRGKLSMNPGRKRQLELFRILFHIICFFCERQENCFLPEGVWKSELLVAATNFLGSLVRQLMYISGWSGGPVVFVVVGYLLDVFCGNICFVF